MGVYVFLMKQCYALSYLCHDVLHVNIERERESVCVCVELLSMRESHVRDIL